MRLKRSNRRTRAALSFAVGAIALSALSACVPATTGGMEGILVGGDGIFGSGGATLSEFTRVRFRPRKYFPENILGKFPS